MSVQLQLQVITDLLSYNLYINASRDLALSRHTRKGKRQRKLHDFQKSLIIRVKIVRKVIIMMTETYIFQFYNKCCKRGMHLLCNLYCTIFSSAHQVSSLQTFSISL